MAHRVLIADDETSICKILSSELERAGFNVKVAYNGDEVISLCSTMQFDCAVLDMKMPRLTGLECVRIIKEKNHDMAIIIMTAFASINQAVAAMKAGADDYIPKPFDASELIDKINELITLHNKKKVFASVSLPPSTSLVGKGSSYHTLCSVIQKVSSSNATVLITGESGTGKSVVARAIHTSGCYMNAPFIQVNCSAVPANLIESELFGHEKGAFTTALCQKKGKFELAKDGTIFLDEIGTLSLESQAKLLNVLQERSFFRVGGIKPIEMHSRVIAATNEDLELAIEEGRFRQDLFYRLNVIRIECLPLRKQKEMLDELVPYFLERYANIHNCAPRILMPDAMEAIRAYDWPGNIRELENMIESVLVLSDNACISVEDLPQKLRVADQRTNLSAASKQPISLREQEISSIIAAMERNGGHRAKTAKDLGISVRTLQYKLKKLGYVP